MFLDKYLFNYYLKNHMYAKCIEMMQKCIIDVIVSKIREKLPEYEYTGLKDLKLCCFKYLSDIYQDVVTELYSFDFESENYEYELYCMLDLYKELL